MVPGIVPQLLLPRLRPRTALTPADHTVGVVAEVVSAGFSAIAFSIASSSRHNVQTQVKP